MANRVSAQARFAAVFFLLFTGFGVFTPYFQRLLYAQGFNEEQIGYLLAILETVGILTPPLWGWLSDFTGHRKPLLGLAVLGSALAFISFGQIRVFVYAAAGCAVLGFFYRAVIPLTDGLVLRYIDRHGGDYGRPRALGSFGFIAMVAIMEVVGVAGDESHARRVILTAMALASLAHFLSVWSLPVPAQDRAAPPRTRLFSRPEDFDWSRLLTPQFLLLCAAAFVSRFGMSGYYSFFTLFVRNELGFQQAGYLWILGPVSEIPLIFFSTRIIARIGVRRMFLLGVGATALRLAGMAVARDVWVLIPLQLLHALTFGAFHTACIHFIQYLVPSSMKQVAVALFMAGTLGSAAIAGSAVGGVLVHRLGYSTMYGCFAAIALLGVVLARFLREPTPHATAASAGQPESVFESDDRQDA